MDVFHHDGRVIDQHADREREPAERHQVDGLAGQEQADDTRKDRERDRDRDHDRVPPASKEHENHQRHEN